MTLLFVLSGAPLPLLLGLGLGLSVALFALYLLREQHRPLVVPFVELWRRVVQKKSSSVPWQRLRRLLSLLLQLVLLGLVLLALADPRGDDAASQARTVVFLVDVSPSMAAAVSEGSAKTRLDEAKERLARFALALRERDRALIVSLSARPRVETGFTNDRSLLKRTAASLEIRHSAVDLRRGLALAREIGAEHDSVEVVLVGDGAYPELEEADTAGLNLSFESVSAATTAAPENIGISNFSARRYPDEPRRFEAQLELRSTAKTSAEVELLLSALDPSFQTRTTIEVQRALIPPEGSIVIPLPELSGATEGVVAEVRRVDGGGDFLPTDNRAQLLLLPLPPLRILVLGAPNQFLEAALLTEPSLLVEREGDRSQAAARSCDIVIHDGAPSAIRPGSAALYLGTPKDKGPFPVRLGRKLENFGFDRWQRESSLFKAVDPYDVQVLEGRALIPGPSDTALAFSGADPIVVMGQRPEGRFVALGFDPRQSDFFLRAAWPLFLHNTLWELAPRVVGEDGIALSPGRQWHLRTPAPDRSARIVGPLGTVPVRERRTAVTEQSTTVFGELAGFYEVQQSDLSSRFFANYFDEAESRLPSAKALAPVKAQGSPSQPQALPRPRPFRRERDVPPWLILLSIALLLSFSEWWSYHRRWTV